jgi:hypothetical protein
LAAFVLLAFAVRALVPGGYMIGESPNGRFLTITLCSSASPADVFLDLKTGQVVEHGDTGDQPDKSKHDAPCAFASVAHLAAPRAPTLVNAPLRLAIVAANAADSVTPGRGLAAPPPWATGPPPLT